MKMRTRIHLAILALSLALAACSHPDAPRAAAGPLEILAVEGVYADIAAQIGGDAVRTVALQHGVDADPHAYEPTTTDASEVERADVVIRNGLGYDAFVSKLLDESAGTPGRTVFDVGTLMRRASGDNPHLWYDVDADRRLGRALATEFERRAPAKRSAIAAREAVFARSLDAWSSAIGHLGRRGRGARIATTEPVFAYVISRAGLGDVTPRSFALAIEQGNDPAPQDIAKLDALVPSGVRALVVNSQTVEPATTRLVARARAGGVPVVSVTESLPDGEPFQRWVIAETRALADAVAPRDASR